MFRGAGVGLVWYKIDVKTIGLFGELDVGAIVVEDIEGIIHRQIVENSEFVYQSGK